MCKSLKLSGAEERPQDAGLYIFFFLQQAKIWPQHFLPPFCHSSQCFTRKSKWMCAIFKTSSHFKKKKEKRIVGDIFTSCVFLWCCFLKNNINHSDFLSRRKSACEWLPFGFPCLKKKNLHGQKKKKKNAILPLKLNISAGHTEWWVNQREGFFPSHHPTRTHTRANTNTNTHMLRDRNIHTLVDRAVHWGGLCFLSVGGRDEVMINMGDVWKCKSVLQHK